MSYKCEPTRTALGIQHEFRGPGLSRHASGVHFLQPLNDWAAQHAEKHPELEAAVVLRMLHEAFEAGRADAKKEMRRTLGIDS